jgi:hypothetical protein
VEHDEHFRAYEVVEEKPCYDESFRRIERKWVQAGNGGDEEQKWTGRSLRMLSSTPLGVSGALWKACIHGIEGTAQSGAIPYFSRYFSDFAGMNLIGAIPSTPGPPSMPSTQGPYRLSRFQNGRHFPQRPPITLSDYIAHERQCPFTPNGRFHNDLQNGQDVLVHHRGLAYRERSRRA